MLLSIIAKALLIIALPITLVVYACLVVGAQADDITPKLDSRH